MPNIYTRDGTGASGNNTFTPPLLTVIAYS